MKDTDIVFPAVPEGQARLLGTIALKARRRPLAGEDIRRALLKPVWGPRDKGTVFDLISPGETVCFVVSDHTRQTATDRVLPVVLNGLLGKGCSAADMFILVASGIHRHPTATEIARILGPEACRVFEGRVFPHDPDNQAELVTVGTTRRGHSVRVNRRAVEADRLVLIGAANYHYHAGFGGGRKSLVPGVASRETIAYNHSLTLDPREDRIHPGAEIGVLDGNPVSEEMLEGARMCEPDIIINTVLTPSGELAGVFSGDLDAAHRAACSLVEKVSRVDIKRQADFVMASAGDSRDWIQSHKALFNAHRAIRRGGKILLIAPCPEGLGNERFRYWVRKKNLADIYGELRKSPEVLGQTALSTKTRGADAILVTKMPRADADDLGIETAPDADAALARVLRGLADQGISRPTCYLMPNAKHSVPFVASAQ